MPKLNHFIELRQDFCWRNRNLMGLLAPQERKMFFAPFALVDPRKEYHKDQVIDVPLPVMVAFLQCKPDIAEATLTEALREGYKAITAAAKGDMPYIYKGIRNGNARFILKDCSIFQNLGNKSRCTFNLDEISNYADGRVRDNKPLPLLWFVQSVVAKFFDSHDDVAKNTAYPLCEIVTDDNGVPVRLLMTVGHEELKKIMGYGKYSYTNIPSNPKDPKANREFFLDFVDYLPKIYLLDSLRQNSLSESNPTKRRQTEWAINKILEEQKAFEKKYDDTPIDVLHDRYKILWKKTQHRYQPFADKVIKPAICELNAGDMLHFCLLENQRKPARRTKEQIKAGEPVGTAILEMTYIRNNYSKKENQQMRSHGHIFRFPRQTVTRRTYLQ